jgi:hypothetical protein
VCTAVKLVDWLLRDGIRDAAVVVTTGWHYAVGRNTRRTA